MFLSADIKGTCTYCCELQGNTAAVSDVVSRAALPYQTNKIAENKPVLSKLRNVLRHSTAEQHCWLSSVSLSVSPSVCVCVPIQLTLGGTACRKRRNPARPHEFPRCPRARVAP